jgi:hypothetical protein
VAGVRKSGDFQPRISGSVEGAEPAEVGIEIFRGDAVDAKNPGFKVATRHRKRDCASGGAKFRIGLLKPLKRKGNSPFLAQASTKRAQKGDATLKTKRVE